MYFNVSSASLGHLRTSVITERKTVGFRGKSSEYVRAHLTDDWRSSYPSAAVQIDANCIDLNAEIRLRSPSVPLLKTVQHGN